MIFKIDKNSRNSIEVGKGIKRIHVNQHIIKSNNKTGEREPVFTIKFKKKTYTANSISIEGTSKLVYKPDKPLSCGAKVWIETTNTIITDTEHE